ncbi:amino acid adenylation enzyme/thioester reductase family protein [Cylindrospermum stagnale PCC 7417]|uniref:Amino acid adenylation enzyme/thioester reductase family protein n=1 Tax=Cylindrospermum stagnale PCC 7417 TaxID=56107 RepID=K9X8V8_9NOST|nr:non-ribosomal peptide synthetase [Cylindrospermum stagnale]AFZ28072.1 amino acid adenylation enzyme/thioester reductase family protein [Cylindrospermum stagnale PCC 7417]
MNIEDTYLESCSNAERFWRDFLRGFTAPLKLSAIANPTSSPPCRGTQEIRLTSSKTLDLTNLTQNYQLSLYSLIQGAMALLLSHYSGETDILFGATRACRQADSKELCLNILPVRVSIHPGTSVLSWLRELQAQWMALQDYESISLGQIRNWSQVPPESPLFETLVILANDGLEAELQEQGDYPLVLSVDAESDLLLKIDYERTQFADDAIARMLGHLETIFTSLLNLPQQSIADIPLLTAAQRHQLLVEWNQTEANYPQDKCIHHLFEEQVERTPDAVAVVFEQQQLTYRELNQRANQLAQYLQTLGVQPEVLVGICTERSLEMIVGILGILKAGGAYVPLDIAYPKERLAFMLSDSQVSLLLTQQHLVEKLPEHQAKIICLDGDGDAPAKTPEKQTASAVKATNLAYVIYTSGSTGKPKGVLIPHCNVVRLFAATQSWFQFNQNDIWSLFHSYAFDFSVWELWGALLYGGRLVIVPYYVSRTPELFYNLLSQEKITVLNQTPSAFQQILQLEESLNVQRDLSLRYVIFGGETLNIQSLRPWFERHGEQSPQLVNMYGITETTVHVTYRPLTIADLDSSRNVIGRKIPDLQQYILNSQLQPVPIGVPGEIYIGGAGLARGYLNRPELTAQRFILHPFSQQPEARLYKSGDLVRYLANGDIEYLGRLDNQVKIRGFRIEIGEIEALLNQHSAIRETKVIAREDIPGDKRLVAYFVFSSKQNSPSEILNQLRQYLQQQLPDYMVPSAFVLLESFPLTPNGKIDHRALPAPNLLGFRRPSNYLAPRTPTEEILANLWREVLQVEPIGIDDNFFELGGHSLLATQVISRIRQGLNLEVSVRSLFEFPTIAQLAPQISTTPQTDSLTLPPIPPRKHQGTLPLSFAQQRLWFLDQLQPNSTAYHLSYIFQIQGTLNLYALQQSLGEIIQRHEILHTNFPAVDGQAIQVIVANIAFNLPIIDLQSLPVTQQKLETQRIANQEAQQPFNLAQDPLLRLKLLRLSPAENLLLLNIHHIIFDGWSFGVLFTELKTLYPAFCEAQPSQLPQLPIQYADFTLWQHQWLSGEVLDSQLHYWKQQLGGTLPLLQLPTDHPRPPVQTYQGASFSLILSPELTANIKSLSQQEGVTLFMTLLAAFKILLYRYTGQENVIVGTPIAGRNRREIESLIGFFVNTLALRTDLGGNPSFRELLGRVRQVCLEAYTHQDLPFEQLVTALQPERHLSHTPVFQVMFALDNAPMGEFALPGLAVTPLASPIQTAKFDLTLSMEERNGQLTGEWEYNTDLFEAATIERMIKHFQTLLSGITAHPNQSIWKLPLLTEAEKHQLLIEWNQTEADYPQDKCIHQLFEEQVERTPDAIAVVFEQQQLTYRELNQRANQLAHYLQKRGVGTEALVGICVERSLEMIIAVLSTLKAGGAYLPLDPAYPQERLAFMVQDAQVSILLTQTELLPSLPVFSTQLINLDTDWQQITQFPSSNPINTQLQPKNLAYIIYTSGSTGQPKGVMIQHCSLVNTYFAWETIYQLRTTTTSHLQMASFSFDVFSGDLIRTLCSGGKLVLCPRHLLLSPELLYGLMQKEKVDCADFVPAVLRNLVQYLESSQQRLDFMRLLICGSDSWSSAEYQKILQLSSSQTRLINSYGLTEATIDSSYFETTAKNLALNQLLPIGRPFPNTQLCILDKHLQPVPIGVAGELYIGGVNLARGYRHRTELTTNKFIPNPFSKNPGERLYKTGDLVRYLPDGNIEFLQRIDNQVKIRGFRIEIGEIEATINQNHNVTKAVVIVREDIPDDKRLVAYVVPHSTETSVLELRNFLKSKLPGYMIPSAFVLLEEIPLTPNGKIDHRALPAPNVSFSQSNYVAPRTPTEEILANLWREILKVELISIHDNFFELGGHSLLATQVISRIRQVFNREIPLRLLFESPNIAQLSSQLGKTKSLPVPPIQPRKQPENLPLSFAQQRLWFLDQLEPNSTAYNMPFTLRLQGLLNIHALSQTIAEIIQRHQILHTNFAAVAGQLTQVINDHNAFSLPIIDLQSLPNFQREAEAQKIANEEAQQPFNLVHDSLFRVKLLRLNEAEHLLLLNIHHIIFDGWSFGVLFAELKAVYAAFCLGHSLPLQQLPIQYADFALWQRQWLSGQVLDSQLNYWKRQLGGTLPVLDLPTDYPRPPMQTYQGAAKSFVLSLELTASIKSLCQKEGATLFMTLLAAFKILLCRYSGQDDVIVGTPIAGRNRTEIEDLIGFFVNTLALRTDLAGNPSFRELLGRVRQVCLEAYAHQDLPFEKLVEELQPERNLSHTPLFQVWFNMINLSSDSLELMGLKVEPVSILETASKFDLSLYIREENQQIHLQLVYNTLLFNADTIQWMGMHLQRLLAGIAANPEKPISTFPLLTKTERYELSHPCNLIRPTNSFNEFPKQEIEQSIPARFEQQAKKYPHNIAVKTKNYQWTYRELNLQAHKIAQILLQKNLNRDAKIALLFDHDAPMVSAILGVLKLGQIYVPLEPKYPRQRVLSILEDSLCQLVLTNNKNLADAQKITDGKLPIINIDDINVNDFPEEITQEISADTLAYILYTSGSTGKPKGVIQNHRNVLHFIRNYTNNLHVSPNDKLTLFSSYSFDAAIIDIFSAILNGATLYPFNIKVEGLAHLSEWLDEQEITIYHSTPTVYRQFIQILPVKPSIEKTQLSKVRLVVLGGEEVVKSDVELYQKHFSHECILVNGLGSTESSFNLQYLIDKKTQLTQKQVPVGYPFDDTEIILLDESGNPTDILGEIAIRSPHIALGYWQKPELTKVVFLNDSEGSNKRIYRTGDLGRLRVNGAIEFLGRKDFQVKIRGFRIELGEIEAVLSQHPAVQEAVVITREVIPGEKRLVAYIIPRSNPNLNQEIGNEPFTQSQSLIINQLKQSLKQNLPDYMVPSAFVLLDVLPLTPNGKINRRALPAPDFAKFESEKYTTPTDNLELQLTKIWENVLGIQPIGLSDNFFDVGGHSLLAIRLFAQIEKIFGKHLALTTLFQSPTIRQLANVLRQEGCSTSWSSLVPIQPNGSKPPFFYIHTVYGGLIHSHNLLSKMNSDQPIYGLQAQGLDGKKPPHTCIEDMAGHYIKEIQTVQPHGPYFLGGWCAGGMIAYEIAQQLYAQGETVELLVIFDAYPPKMISQSNTSSSHLSWRQTKSSLDQSILHLIDTIKRNRSLFATLKNQQQIISIGKKINHRIYDRIKEIIYKFYLNKNLTLPHSLRELAVRDAISQAYKNYFPQVYSGKVIFFRAVIQPKEYADYLKQWEELAAGGLEIHDIPGHHDSILSEPNVRVLAEKLRACIAMH